MKFILALSFLFSSSFIFSQQDSVLVGVKVTSQVSLQNDTVELIIDNSHQIHVVLNEWIYIELPSEVEVCAFAPTAFPDCIQLNIPQNRIISIDTFRVELFMKRLLVCGAPEIPKISFKRNSTDFEDTTLVEYLFEIMNATQLEEKITIAVIVTEASNELKDYELFKKREQIALNMLKTHVTQPKLHFVLQTNLNVYCGQRIPITETSEVQLIIMSSSRND